MEKVFDIHKLFLHLFFILKFYLSTDFYFEFLEAKEAHKTFLQLNGDDSEAASKKSTLYENAERSYRAAAKVMSQKLADSYVNFDLFSIITGLICLASV